MKLFDFTSGGLDLGEDKAMARPAPWHSMVLTYNMIHYLFITGCRTVERKVGG
jgi:hypothetical protein